MITITKYVVQVANFLYECPRCGNTLCSVCGRHVIPGDDQVIYVRDPDGSEVYRDAVTGKVLGSTYKSVSALGFQS